MNQPKIKIFILIAAIVGLFIAIYAYFFGYFQKDFVASRFAIVVPIQGKNVRIDSITQFAFTKSKYNSPTVYVRANGIQLVAFFYNIAQNKIDLDKDHSIAMQYQDVGFKSNMIKISYIHLNAFDTYTLIEIQDPLNQRVLAYSDDEKAPEQYHENRYVKEIVETDMCRSHGHGGCNPVKDPYINISEILLNHFHTKLRYSIDEKNRLIIITPQSVK